jgi:glutathione S-transferase
MARSGDSAACNERQRIEDHASIEYGPAMKLYGTTTSPFVRRVRVVAAEVGEPIDMINTAHEDGQKALRQTSPIWKVPVAEIDGRTLFDSRAIIDWLVTTRGWGGLTPPKDRWAEGNIVNAIDAALDSAIQLFYLKRENVPAEGTPFHAHNMGRADAIFAWLGTQLAADRRSFGGGGLGLAEISIVATLDWMDFRATYPTDRAGHCNHLRAHWADHPSLATTRPHT